ncbi:helix-turn-helix domain-containing protein [Leucobacter sp. UT-8R-CII-1-4]|uniref:helix-turn-helix domain-containing protein n=1 Tax=Leucobacter sp. UT-8R-CII-1-4 TaxID=3040075 RepID=UPI0024A81D00|nr:helix-turn-helix domain-containing protein [Leucobacter sp. UT-8R-CII-1-4]MDI6021955.1 helix-turn-helix domain-containing protein [Leucobacter sp. UT-8R-CII-1-4]
MKNSSAFLHPVRLRVIRALLRASDGLTTAQLHERMPEIAIATLYRQLAHLAELGVIEVAETQQIRGANEKSYRVSAALANPTPEELRAATPDELLSVFSVFSTGLIQDFDNYVHGDSVDLTEDRVSFAQADFWATTEEIDAFFNTFMQAIQPLLSNTPGEGRRQHSLATVFLPQQESVNPEGAS